MEGKHRDEFPKDDASIEILSESVDSLTWNNEWSIHCPDRSSIAGSEMSVMDFQKLSIDSKMATIFHHEGFFVRRDFVDGGLPYSAEFYLNGEVWKVSGEDCLLMSPRRYIAKVTLEDTAVLDGADGFEEAVWTLLQHLKVVKVLMDEELEECIQTKSVLEIALNELAEASGEDIDRKRDVILLRMLLKKHGNSLNVDFQHDLRNCSRLSSEIMSTLDNYVTKALKLIQRNEFLGLLNDSSISNEFINDAIEEALNHHRARLAAICPSSMKYKLKDLPDDRILYVTMDDMHLFTDLITLDEGIFEAVLPMLFSKFLTRVQEINDEQFPDLEPLSNGIFLYLCKSLQEVAEQLGAHIKINIAIIYSEALGWEVTKMQEESQTAYSKCLRQQLQMLAKLANHFEPGGPFRTHRFPYEFKLFQNMDAITEPVRIWLYILDDCMKDLVQADLDKMKMLSCFFKSYVSFIVSEDFRSETLECLRTITHDALRSLAVVTSSQQERTISGSVSLKYNKMIKRCLDKFPREYFVNECDHIETMLQQVICQAMDMNVSSGELSKFSNVLEQFLNDLRDLQLEWFIKLPPSDKRILLLQHQLIVPVNSIWENTEFKCFKVENLEGFVEMYILLYNSEDLPNHYQLKVIQVLLQNLEKLVSKQSCNDEKHLSDKDLLGAMTVMINPIRDSLVLLKEQPDYCCFEDFLLKMSKLCAQAIKEEEEDLSHTHAIDSEDIALDPLLDRFEGSISKAFLKNSLKLYTTHFNKHLAESARLSREKRIEKIVSDVNSKMNRRIKLAKSWTEEFKRNELPEVLAGLSAVWSIIVSEKESGSEKMTNHSLLQISSILSIFGQQKSHNKYHHHQLLKLSTQQGKEFVLGLIAALLALYGHKVHIVCFNSHLTRINSLDWIRVFRRFSILSNISYESLQDTALEGSKGIYEKYTAYINKCFGSEITANNDNEQESASEDERSVLLIEDIDIILQKPIRIGAFKRLIRPTIPGLKEVQQKLFCQKEPIEGNAIDEYIKHSINPNIRDLRAFLDRPHSYIILEGNPFEEVEYTNKTLFFRHLEAMKKANTMKEYCSGFQQVVAGDNIYGYLPLEYIPFPYATLLKSFQLVLNFTIAPLEVCDETMLHDHYGSYHSISESDIFQTIPTTFDPKHDFLYVDSKDEQGWMDAIIVAMKVAIDRNCLVLVFFKSAKEMDCLQQTELLKQLNVTAIKNASNRDILPEHDIDEISVLMVCNGHFSKDRQFHLIQTFFSGDGKEEDLIRRQAERSHCSGSYELIIPRISNMNPINNEYPKIEEMTYNWFLKNKRSQSFKFSCLWNMPRYKKIKKFLKL